MPSNWRRRRTSLHVGAGRKPSWVPVVPGERVRCLTSADGESPLHCRRSTRAVGNAWTAVIRSCGAGEGNGPTPSLGHQRRGWTRRCNVQRRCYGCWPNESVRSNTVPRRCAHTCAHSRERGAASPRGGKSHHVPYSASTPGNQRLRYRRSAAGWKPAGWSTRVSFHDSMSYCSQPYRLEVAEELFEFFLVFILDTSVNVAEQRFLCCQRRALFSPKNPQS